MKKNKSLLDGLIKILVIFTVWMVLLLICIMYIFKNSSYGDNLLISDYFNFVGSFGGAALSSIISFLILFISILFSKIEQKDNMLNSVRPILKINFISRRNEVNHKIYYTKVDSKESNFDNLNFSIKNIGTGPARGLKIKIDNEYVTTFGGLIEKSDLGVSEELSVDLRTKYESLLVDDYCDIFIECVDIYNKRQYIFEVRAIKQKGHTSVEYYELKDEKIIEL